MNNAITTGGQTITDSTSNAKSMTTAVVGTSSLAQIAGKFNKAVRFIPANMYDGASAATTSVSGTGTSGPIAWRCG